MYLDPNGIMMVEETDNVSPLQVLLNAMQSATSAALADSTSMDVREVTVSGPAWGSGGNLFLAKVGRLISMNLNKQATASLSWETVMGTAPSGFRPNVVTYTSVAYGPNYGAGAPGCTIRIDTNGRITAYPQNAQVTGAQWLRGTANWWTA